MAVSTGRHAKVIATCQGPGRLAEMRASYLVTGAGWSPQYDVDARDAGGKLVHADDLCQRPAVHRRGLAPGPAERGPPPIPPSRPRPRRLIPLDIRAQPRDPPRRQAVSRAEAVPTADQVAPSGAAVGTEAALPASDQGLSVRLSPPVPADVPGDGTTVRILAASLALPGRPLLRAIPSRPARVSTGWWSLPIRVPFPLLPGPMRCRDG